MDSLSDDAQDEKWPEIPEHWPRRSPETRSRSRSEDGMPTQGPSLLTIVIIVVVVAAISATAVYFIMRRQKEEDDTPTTQARGRPRLPPHPRSQAIRPFRDARHTGHSETTTMPHLSPSQVTVAPSQRHRPFVSRDLNPLPPTRTPPPPQAPTHPAPLTSFSSRTPTTPPGRQAQATVVPPPDPRVDLLESVYEEEDEEDDEDEDGDDFKARRSITSRSVPSSRQPDPMFIELPDDL